MAFKKPYRLKEGDTVGVVSPSWGGPSVFPLIYESGIRALEELGLRIKEFPSARAEAGYLSANPKARAKDINAAFSDQKVKAVIATIGGDDSVRILPYIDRDVVRSNPKILLGYSDTSTLLTYFNQLGLVTLHGPAIMAGFSQWSSLPEEARNHTRQMLFDPQPEYTYPQFSEYVEGYPDWTNKSNVGKINPLKKADGWRWIQGTGSVEGRLYGGCFEVLEFMKGTDYWPKPTFWKDKVFFLETSEEKPTPDQVKFMLRNYGMQGVYDKISALLIGRARDYSDEEKSKLDEVVLSVVRDEFGNKRLPIVTNMDFGHTDPQLILPLGVKSEVNCRRKQFKLTEAALR